MIDEIIMVFVSAILTAVGFFAVKWMTSIDAMINEVKQRVDSLGTSVLSLEHDHIPLKEYIDNINSVKSNHVIIQERIVKLEHELSDIRTRLNNVQHTLHQLSFSFRSVQPDFKVNES